MSTAAIPSQQVRPSHTTGDPPAPVARRLVLVPASTDRGDELVRRYRLARLRLEPRETRGEQRFEHLKRSYD